MPGQPAFEGGRNIAMKVPAHHYDATVQFYRDTLRLPVLAQFAPNVVFAFGANQLWIDRVPGAGQTELWLEMETAEPEAAADWLAEQGLTRCDEAEPLPEGFRGRWISSPAGVVHLVRVAQS